MKNENKLRKNSSIKIMSPNWPTFKSNIDSNINYIMIIFKITKNFFHQNAYYTCKNKLQF